MLGSKYEHFSFALGMSELPNHLDSAFYQRFFKREVFGGRGLWNIWRNMHEGIAKACPISHVAGAPTDFLPIILTGIFFAVLYAKC